MKDMKGIIILIGAIGIGALGGYLYVSSMLKYAILAFTVSGVLLLTGLGLLLRNSNPTRAYEGKVNSILNTYDSVLVKSNTPPVLDNRNIVTVMSMEDLIDAQMEIRKPICYLKQTESCSFVLLDDKEAYIYIEKLREDVTSPVEIAIQECKIKNKNKEEMDSEMLRDIEKTTVVKLSNQKSYKVSPIRKKKTEEKNADDEDKKMDEKIDAALNNLEKEEPEKKEKTFIEEEEVL